MGAVVRSLFDALFDASLESGRLGFVAIKEGLLGRPAYGPAFGGFGNGLRELS